MASAMPTVSTVTTMAVTSATAFTTAIPTAPFMVTIGFADATTTIEATAPAAPAVLRCFFIVRWAFRAVRRFTGAKNLQVFGRGLRWAITTQRLQNNRSIRTNRHGAFLRLRLREGTHQHETQYQR